jgi:hypothetical protein
MGLSYLDLLMAEQDLNQGALVSLVLHCSSHTDPAINETTLNFWYYLTEAVARLVPSPPGSRALVGHSQ